MEEGFVIPATLNTKPFNSMPQLMWHYIPVLVIVNAWHSSALHTLFVRSVHSRTYISNNTTCNEKSPNIFLKEKKTRLSRGYFLCKNLKQKILSTCSFYHLTKFNLCYIYLYFNSRCSHVQGISYTGFK